MSADVTFLIIVLYYLRLWGVQGVGAVPHILGTVENTEGQTGKEVTRGQITSHRPDGKSGAFWEEEERIFLQGWKHALSKRSKFLSRDENLPLRKRETSSSWGMLSSRNSQYLESSGRFFKYSRQAWVGYNLLSSLYTTPQVFTSSSVNSIRGIGSPLQQETIIL